MPPLVGMAGLAEASEAYALSLAWIGLFVMVVMGGIAFLLRSSTACVVTLLFAGVVAIMFSPWTAFRIVESADPDVHSWAHAWRGFAPMWVFGTAISVAAAIGTIVRNERAERAQLALLAKFPNARALADAGQRLEAVRCLSAETGVSIATATLAVDAYVCNRWALCYQWADPAEEDADSGRPDV